ncbi:hypothetical protein Tco_0488178 [Tanacetum coccineum]
MGTHDRWFRFVVEDGVVEVVMNVIKRSNWRQRKCDIQGRMTLEVVEGFKGLRTSISFKQGFKGGIMVNLIFMEGFEEEALVEFMVDRLKK